MAPTYSDTMYLLDRANIQDVIQLLYLYFDTGDYEKMADGIFGDKVTMDCTDLWGGDPFTVTGMDLVKQWQSGLQSKAAAAQHIVSSIVPSLPQPGGTSCPTTAHAVANGSTLIRSVKDNLVQNSGRLYVDLIKLDKEVSLRNPWRITGLRTEMVWEGSVPLHQLADDWVEYHEPQQVKGNC